MMDVTHPGTAAPKGRDRAGSGTGLARKGGRALKVRIAVHPPLLQAGLACLIEQLDSRVELQTGAASGSLVLERVVEERPDVLIVQPTLPEMNGVDLIRRLKRDMGRHAPAFVLLTGDPRQAMLSEALRGGANGVLTEDVSREEVAKALEAVSAGRSYFSETASEALAAACGAEQGGDLNSVYKVLTQTERRVMQLLAEGMTTKEIGQLLSISSKTADTHRRNLMNKLSLSGVASLTRRAIREGLISLD